MRREKTAVMKATQAEPAQDPDVGDVSDPQLVRPLGGEAALHEVRTSIRLICRPRGDRRASAPHPFHAGELHQSGDLVPADLPPGAAHRVVHLSDTVDAVVLRVDPAEFLHEDPVPQRSRRPGSCLRGAVAAGGDEPTFRRTQGATDGLDPELIAVFVDERDHLVVGRSSSLAKKA